MKQAPSHVVPACGGRQRMLVGMHESCVLCYHRSSGGAAGRCFGGWAVLALAKRPVVFVAGFVE